VALGLLVNVPIGLAALAFGVVFLADQRLDYAGTFGLPGFLLSGAASGCSCTACPRARTRAGAPADRGELRDRLFSVSNTVMVLASIAFLDTVYLVSLFYQDGLGLSALQAGLSMFPEAVGVMLGAQVVAKRLYPVLGPRKIIAAGLLPTGAGITALVAIGPATSLWWARLVQLVMGLACPACSSRRRPPPSPRSRTRTWATRRCCSTPCASSAAAPCWLPLRGRPGRFRNNTPVDRRHS
jgi:hypothetical protein